MSANSMNFSEKSEYDDELKSSEFERFQRGMKADFSKLIDEVQHFPQQRRSDTLKQETRQNTLEQQAAAEEEEEEEEEEDYDDDHHTEDVWADDIASSVETGMPHPDIDGISFHSDVDIYGDLEDVQDRSSSDSWERHLDDVDEDYKLRPPRKKTSGSVISVQSVGNYFLSKSFPVSDFDEVLNSQRTTESGSMDDGSETNELLSFQALLQSRFSQLPTKLHDKTEYYTQEEEEEEEAEASFHDEHISQHSNSLSSPENISISEAISSSASAVAQPQKEFKYAISPESFLFECRYARGKLTTKRAKLNIYNPSSAVTLEYRLDSINDFLLFSSLSGTVPEQSPVVISVRLNTDTIRQHYEENMQSLSDKILVFIDDMPPSELEVIISMDPDIDLSDKRDTDLRKVPTFTYDACCKICNIENDAELYIE